ncbi:MAG TPA: glycosyltransferase [Nakamurella sp.]|jgi:GT2 family glycosyltransferase|nr:glycosyltransferase [Nakamurella sp.]
MTSLLSDTPLAIQPHTVLPIKVTVGIPTFHRPEQVARTVSTVLQQIEQLPSPGGGPTVDVLVVDNDPAGSAAAAIAGLGSPVVRYVVEARPGISAARNRMLDECGRSDLLVCIDDDEYPHPGWLRALLDTYLVDRPAAVYGRVVAQFDGPLDPWIAAGHFFARFDAPDGAQLTAAATGNLLLDLHQLRSRGLRFDDRLGLSGGEDTMLTRALAGQGGRIVRCAGSVVTHRIAVDRMTRRWVLQRSWSHGNTHAVVDVLLAPDAGHRIRVRGKLLAAGVVRALAGSARSGYGLLVRSQRHQARGLRTTFRGVGMVSAAVGFTFQEYARRSRKGWF